MKATFLRTLLLSYAAACMISCTEDLEDLVVAPTIVGAWALESVEYDVRTDVVNNGEMYSINHSGLADIHGLTMDISDDPTNTFLAEGYYTIEVPADLAGSTFKDIFPFSDIFKRGTWSKETDRLMYFNFEGLPAIKAKIIKFSEKKLIISYDITNQDEIEGVACTHTVHGLYTFSKE